MSLPQFITNIQRVEWTEVNLGELNPKAKSVSIPTTKSKTVDDVSDGTEPVASLHLPGMEDYSVVAKTSELIDFTISIDSNNAAKVDDETHVTKIKAKSTLKESLLGAMIFRSDKTAILYTNPIQALTECERGDDIHLVSYDSYIDSSWKSIPLSTVYEAISDGKTMDFTTSDLHTNYILVQYRRVGTPLNIPLILSTIERVIGCSELIMDYQNTEITTGKLWLRGDCDIPDKLSHEQVNKILGELGQMGVDNVFTVTRKSFNPSTEHER